MLSVRLKIAFFFSILVVSPGLQAGNIDFARDIQPIFAEHCTTCHGPDEQKGGLNLTREKSLHGKLKSGEPALVPGKPDDSELLYRITTQDTDELMPPSEHGARLKPTEIALIRQWIFEGAKWSQHWSYRPLKQIPLPKVHDSAWIQNEIDHFVLAKLEERQLKPSPRADRNTLIKRLNYDLIGLPPTPKEVSEFINDKSPKAYDSLVERLLASPHFGERWGRHWLDKARYADSDGYEKDRPRMNAWRYRDWVINSINADLPFDQFTIEQLAGDLLPNATALQKLATAFNRQTLTNTEGGTDREQWRVAAVMDRVETLGSVWLGLTVGCARCHNHKYDQLSQKEYYQLFAYFNNGDESNASIPRSRQALVDFEDTRKAHEAKIIALQAEITKHDTVLKKQWPALEKELQADMADRPTSTVAFHAMDFLSAQTEQNPKVKFQLQDDSSLLVSGDNPATAEYKLEFKTSQRELTGIRLEVLPDPSLGGKGPGRTEHGNFVLNDIRVYANTERKFTGKPLSLGKAAATYEQKGWPSQNAIDGKTTGGRTGSGWAIANQFGKPNQLTVTFAKPFKAESDIFLHIVLDQKYGTQHTIGCFRLSARTGHASDDRIPATIAKLLAKPIGQRSAQDKQSLLAYARGLDPEAKRLQTDLKKLTDGAPKPPVMSVRVIAQRTNSPRTTHILHRGEFKQPRDQVAPGVFATLPGIKNRAQGDRLDLARWLVDGQNPIVPRVTANHIWSQLFGEGLVRTMNDFGTRGDAPSHTALLNWLADEFIQLKWRRKDMIRLITQSATYQQSSRHRPEVAENDPNNHLLHRQNRFRVQAETIRDLTLAASGQLSPKIGGPSVFPPLPPGVAELSYANNFKWKTSAGEDQFRRGMYTFFKRTSPHPNLITFDCPDSNITCVQRNISNTPLAALTTLNNAIFTDAAKAMSKRLLSERAEDTARIQLGFQLCTARQPTPTEIAAFADLLAKAKTYYANHQDTATAFNGNPEASAWAVVTRVFLNLDEFITRE